MTHSRMVDPFERLKEYDRDLRQRYESENDPERPPKRDPGDRSILIGAITGLLVGGILGVAVGGLCFGFIGGWLGLLGGFIAGGIIGVVIGDSIRKRRPGDKNSHNSNPY